jgi:predicted nucleic acid-binding protein
MKIVVDTNIIFSAMLNPSATIGQIIIYGQRQQQFEFFAPHLLKEEIKRHRNKIIEISKSIDEVTFEDIRDEVFRCVNFISEEQIPYNFWYDAIPMVRDTDMDDIAFIVLAEYLDARLWTGDKKLLAGLENYGYKRIITTEELLTMKFYGQ